jgi:hypothetical protein
VLRIYHTRGVYTWPRKTDDSAMSEPLITVLQSVTDVLDNFPNVADLRRLRDQLDSWLLRENIRRSLHGLNSPEQIGDIRDNLRALQRKAEELQSSRENNRENVRLTGLGGGAGLVGGAIIAALSIALPIIAIIPAAGGVYLMRRSKSASGKFTEEIRLLEQIADIAGELAIG